MSETASPPRRWLVPASAALAVGLLLAGALWWHLSRGTHLATLRGHRGVVRAVAISGDGRFLATGADRAVRLWDATAYRALATCEGHGKAVHGVAFSADNRLLASAGDDGVVRL